jgi:hypothetical protein
MAFERLPAKISPTGVVEASFRQDSLFVPALRLAIVNQAGAVALVRCNDGVSLRLPDGSIHRPDPYSEETVQHKVLATAHARTNATLGPNAQVLDDFVGLVPFADRAQVSIQPTERERWPRAIGKVFFPVIVPTIIYGEDPQKKYEVLWEQPEQALVTLHDNYSQHGIAATRSALEVVQISMPAIKNATNPSGA